MRVCNLSLDENVLLEGSLVEKRLLSLADSAGEIIVFVPGETDERKTLSKHLVVYSIGGIKLFQFFKLWRKAREVMSLEKFDFVTVQDVSFLALLGFFIARHFSIPLEIQTHGFEKFYGIRKLIARFVFRRADRIRVVSNRLKSELTKSYKLKTDIFYVLPVYAQIVAPMEIPNRERVSGKPFTPLENAPAASRGVPFPVRARGLMPRASSLTGFTFLTVGRLVPVKNIALQISALANVAKEFPNTRLVIVGEGPMLRNLQLSINNYQLGGQIILEGKRDNLEKYYKEADCFLLTSNAEGWGVAVVEASAFGLPIIMTDVGLAGEFIQDGVNGIVVPIGDEEALVLAMKKIIEDGTLREKISENAKESFKSLPGAEASVRKQVEEWEKFI